MLGCALNMEPKVNIALEAARAGCKELLSFAYRLDQLEIKEKGPSNFVTQLDKKVESIIIDSLKSIYPKHTYVSEEVGRLEGSGKDIESMWVIDPLDGTTNYIHGFPYYAISIAYIEKGKTLHALIIDVARQDEFTASLGRGAYLNNRRIRVSKAKNLSGTLLSNSSHDTDKGRVRHDNMSTFRSLYSNGLTIRRTGSAALDMANVAAGTIHLANTTLKQKLVMPTKVVRRVDDFADVDTSSVSNGQIIRYISANDTFIATNRNVELDGGEY